jgi:hypothetical protein
MKQQVIFPMLYSLSAIGTMLYAALAVLTWQRRCHPVALAMFYCAIFTCVMALPLKFLFWFQHHPGAYKAYFYIYWIYEPITDVLDLWIGYRLICWLCNSAALRRIALRLFATITFVTIASLLFFISSSLNPHPVLKSRYLFIMDCSLHLALCTMVLTLVISRKSFGPSGDRPVMQIALALGIISASALISSTLVAFMPHVAHVGHFPLLGCIGPMGSVAGAVIWCFAIAMLDPPEARKCSFQPATLILSRNSLNTAGELLMEIVRR